MKNFNALQTRVVTGLAIAAGAVGVSACAESDFNTTAGFKGDNMFVYGWGTGEATLGCHGMKMHINVRGEVANSTADDLIPENGGRDLGYDIGKCGDRILTEEDQITTQDVVDAFYKAYSADLYSN